MEENDVRRMEPIQLEPTSSSSLSHSPLSLSLHGSDEEEEDDDEDRHHHRRRNSSEEEDQVRIRRKFRPLTFHEVEQSLDKYYFEDDSAVAGELDILITYLKGQKNLHLQSKIVSETRLNILLIPTLMIAAAVTIFAPFVQGYEWSGGFISGLNATTAFLISLVKYLKLESSVELFHHTVNQFDKLETSVEFTTSKMMFVLDTSEKSRIVLEKIQEIEKKVSEIKEWNSQLIPSSVVRVFPVICNMNIFSFIKRAESAKRTLVAKFKDVKNEIRYIEHKTSPSPLKQEKYHRRLEHLQEVKEKIKEELVHHRQAFHHIDQIFTREIQAAQNPLFLSMWWWPRVAQESSPRSMNPVVDRFLVQQQQRLIVTTL